MLYGIVYDLFLLSLIHGNWYALPKYLNPSMNFALKHTILR